MGLTESRSESESGNYDQLDLTGLFEVLEKPLMAYAIRLVSDRATAQDLVQEAFLRLYSIFDEIEKPRPWLYRTVYNLAMNVYRKRKKLVYLEDQVKDSRRAFLEHGEVPLDPDSYIQYQEVIDFIMSQMSSLDERAKKVVELKFQNDFSYKQISQQMGISVSNVGYILHHAIKDLGARLKKGGFWDE